MSFWKKNPNEAAFAGGQKHWADVIKNTGAPNLLLWKQPEEDFNTNSTLSVMPGETAIFVHRGSIEQVFDTPGTYKLTTENYPFIEPFIRIMLQKYGIELESFSIAVFDIADDDPSRQALETAFAQHAHMRILGEDWARLQAAEILKELAQNPGAGGVASMGAGMGMAMSAAAIFANLAQQMFGNAPAATPQQPPKRPAPFGSGFGGGAGYAPQKEGPSVSSPSGSAFPSFEQSATVEEKPKDMTQFKQSLQQLKYMLDQGFITQEAYDAKISEIMKRM